MPHGDTARAMAAIGQALKGIGGALERLEVLLKEHDDRAARRQAELLERVDRLLLLSAGPPPGTWRAILMALPGTRRRPRV